MFDNTLLLQYTLSEVDRHTVDGTAGLRRQAAQRFWRLLLAARLAGLMAHLAGRNSNLQALERGNGARSGHYLGLRDVPLNQIVGSEGRSRDFDQDFRPLRAHNRDRWIGISAARQAGIPLPPVCLIQVGDDYYVRDGHHRISVAKHLGQLEIEAEITTFR